jgi:hypothetical protein
MKNFLWQRTNWFIALCLLCFLAFSLAACSTNSSGNASNKPASTTGAGASPLSTLSSTSTVKMGAQPCPEGVKDPAHWDPIIPTHRPDSRVERVSCGNLLNNRSLQAVVMVRHAGGDRLLDVYVYTDITSAHPTQLFKLQGLNRGQARISTYNTLITAEVDLHSSLNKGQPPAKLTLDLFREYKGVDTAGTFVQVSFPGMFPDLTRWQAEADQEQVNQGHQPWKLDAVQTAKVFAEQFLRGGGTTTLVSGGGRDDLDAHVNLAFPSPRGEGPPPLITRVTLSRLEGNATGIWEVTAVEADWLLISSPQSGLNTRISSPVTVSGFGPQFEGQIGVVWVLDHLYQKIGEAFARASSGISPLTTFTVTFPYTSSFQAGAQEGIVELLHAGGPESEYGAALVKVLVNP